MDLPSVEHLFWLRHDEIRFEAERSRLISEYINSLPEERRRSAYLMQLKIDEARVKLSDDELLAWMVREATELQENLADQFNAIRNTATRLKRSLDDLSESAG